MPHPNWCGSPCFKCKKPCSLDMSIPCSPDCENINNITGEPDNDECLSCDSYKFYKGE